MVCRRSIEAILAEIYKVRLATETRPVKKDGPQSSREVESGDVAVLLYSEQVLAYVCAPSSLVYAPLNVSQIWDAYGMQQETC